MNRIHVSGGCTRTSVIAGAWPDIGVAVVWAGGSGIGRHAGAAGISQEALHFHCAGAYCGPY